jgi:hypothetical protein
MIGIASEHILVGSVTTMGGLAADAGSDGGAGGCSAVIPIDQAYECRGQACPRSMRRKFSCGQDCSPWQPGRSHGPATARHCSPMLFSEFPVVVELYML